MIARMVSTAVLTTTLSASSAAAQTLTADPNKWRAVTYSDLQLPASEAVAYASLWSDRLKQNNDAYAAKGDTRFAAGNAPATESHIVVRSPAKTVVLSVLHTLSDCRWLRTDPATNATLKRCPMRLAIYQAGKASVADAGQGCFIEYQTPPKNAAVDLSRNAVMGAYDIASRTIRAGVVFQGEIANDCQFRVPVPPS